MKVICDVIGATEADQELVEELVFIIHPSRPSALLLYFSPVDPRIGYFSREAGEKRVLP